MWMCVCMQSDDDKARQDFFAYVTSECETRRAALMHADGVEDVYDKSSLAHTMDRLRDQYHVA